VEGAHRFVQRLWRLVQSTTERIEQAGDKEADLELSKTAHKTLSNVDVMIPGLRYNAAVAQIYTLVNALEQAVRSSKVGSQALHSAVSMTVQMVAPMMPHLAEECWGTLGYETMVSASPWPELDETLLEETSITLPVQINGKKRGEVTVAADMDKAGVEKFVLSQDFVQTALSGKSPKKLIVVPGRIVNVVI